MPMFRNRAVSLLRTGLNNKSATFRPGQLEAIERLAVDRARLLVVQRTGWGKSIVYFITTRFLRDAGKGATIVISPLLALIRNQIDAAQRLGLRAATLNSDNYENWQELEDKILSDQIDMLFISPERLANPTFREKVLVNLKVGLFVVDEAHCISDWGHDFRPDYRRIVRILQSLPQNTPALATTATANNRVVEDIKAQLGESLEVIRGTLVRKSLRLQNITLTSKAERMAWLAHYIPKLPNSGIVYTLTVRDAEQVANFLTQCGIKAHPYFSGQDGRIDLEQGLLKNSIKVLVSTSALGMGFDKPDLGFVIHFQRPGSVVAYYQQVGRAGRGIDTAYGILMSGPEDDDILDYFKENAFPAEALINKILQTLDDSDGLSSSDLQRSINAKEGKIKHALKILATESPTPVEKRGSKWFRTPISYRVNQQKVDQIKAIRSAEQQQMKNYLRSDTCLMRFLQQALDDPNATPCGRCSVCKGDLSVSNRLDPEDLKAAIRYTKQSYVPIAPRLKWPPKMVFSNHTWAGRSILKEQQAEPGFALCTWGDIGWGQMVKSGKQQDGTFDDLLVEAMVGMVKGSWRPEPFPTWVTAVPSISRPALVPNFAAKVAERLGLLFKPVVKKIKNTQPQKEMHNSFQQVHNLDGAFEIILEDVIKDSVLLIDDMIDSGWTMSIITALLRDAGAGPVFPAALAKVIS